MNAAGEMAEERKKRVEIKREGKDTVFLIGGRETARLTGMEGTRDLVSMDEWGSVQIERRCEQKRDRMLMEIRCAWPCVHTRIFAVSYDGNPWGTDHEYKGLERNGVPYTFAWHRTSVPGGSSAEGEKTDTALYGDGCPSASLYVEEGKAVHRLIWPETEEPCYLTADGWENAYRGSMEPADCFRAFFFSGDAGKEAAWKQMLSHAFYRNFRRLPRCRSAAEIWRLQCAYAKTLYTEEGDGFCGFNIGLQRVGNSWKKRKEMKYEIGWCGQNASLAVSLLQDYIRNGNRDSKDMALKVLDSWVRLSRSPEGYFLPHYKEEKSSIDACNLGTAGYQFFLAYDAAGAAGAKKEEYQRTAFEICDFILERQEESGRIGMSWNHDGTILQREGTAGCFLVLPLIPAWKRSGKDAYLRAAERAYCYYYQEYRKNGYGTSGALDSRCIDKESVIPLLKGGILLYEATEDRDYLAMAEDAAWYLSGWQWHHSVEFPAGSLLAQIHYDTFGGTAVSTSHLHIDDYALFYVPELLRLAEYTGRKEWRDRAEAVWYNGIQDISDGTLSLLGAEPRPAGSSDEAFLHTRWGGTGKNSNWAEPFGVSQWLVAWPGAFRLETLRQYEGWSFFDGKEE